MAILVDKMGIRGKNKALFLDRDGVINYDRHYLFKIEDFELIPGILDLCLKAKNQGYKLVVITNQSGIARGMYTITDLEKLHKHMKSLFAEAGITIDLILYCPHHPDFTGECLCRKPGKLLFQRAMSLLDIDPSRSFALGDKQRDLDPGMYLGCQTVGIGRDSTLKADILIEFPDQLAEYL